MESMRVHKQRKRDTTVLQRKRSLIKGAAPRKLAAGKSIKRKWPPALDAEENKRLRIRSSVEADRKTAGT